MQLSNQPSNPRPRPGPFLLWGLVVILAAVFIACGPADQPVQERLGNVPQVAQDDPATPTPEPTPMPTACVTIEDEQGQRDRCFTRPALLPERFSKLSGTLAYKIIWSESLDGGASGASEGEDTYFLVGILLEEGNDGDAVKGWLDARDIPYKEVEGGRYPIETSVQMGALIELSQVEGVYVVEDIILPPHTGIWVPTPDVPKQFDNLP